MPRQQTRLRVEGLGPLRAFVDGEEIELGPPKQRAVFAVLALCAGTTVSRAELIDRVWGEAAPKTAAGSLHTYISGLRRALGPAQDLLVGDGAGYSLRISPEHFDVTLAEDRAERARAARDTGGAVTPYEEALRDWTSGTLFPGVPGPFVAQTRRRLDDLRVQLLTELAELVAPARLPTMTGRLLAEIPAHPFDERLYAVTMRALHRGGRTGEALGLYGNLRHRLAADLGISPSPIVETVYTDLLTEDRNVFARDLAAPTASDDGDRPRRYAAQWPEPFTRTDEELAAVMQSRAEFDIAAGNGTEAIRFALTGLEHARASGRRLLEAALLTTVGQVRLSLAQRAAAGEAFAEALRISQDAGDPFQEARARFGLVRCEEPGTDPIRPALGGRAEPGIGPGAEVPALADTGP
ncbi:BTAD domain-containing putative transcriptional regulator [Actinoplanes sp. NPDC020271]|uniref:AfsR/SARP family transcriptional regulator n=1 Tax=Actinoplanes sp. NPDC020271 TaxID=3363896 RepID=UPI0037AEAAD9